MLNSSASCTARLDGAPTAAIIFMPAIAAFCTSSKLARPLNNKYMLVQRQHIFIQCSTDQFIQCVVPAHIFSYQEQFPFRIKQSRGMQSAGICKYLLVFLKDGRQVMKQLGI